MASAAEPAAAMADGRLAGKPREVVLHGLELGDRPLERDALVGVGTDGSRMASSAPAICMARTAAPIEQKRFAVETRGRILARRPAARRRRSRR